MRNLWNTGEFFATKQDRGDPVWRVRSVEAAPPTRPDNRSLLDRVLRRRAPTTFERCLAVHMHFASPRGGLT